MSNLSLEQRIKELRDYGLSLPGETKDWEALVDQAWGLASFQSRSGALADLSLLSLDSGQAWLAKKDKNQPAGQAYRTALSRLAEISQGVFSPCEVRTHETSLDFRCGPYRFACSLQPGLTLDVSFLRTVNEAVCGDRRFLLCDNLETPVILFLGSDTRQSLTMDRGWSFADGFSEPSPPGGLVGFLSNYWEQGMEEAPWLTFQDQRYCESPERGWHDKGLHKLTEGCHLTVMADDSSVRWQGTLKPPDQALWRRLWSPDTTIRPSQIAETEWHDWFHRAPPWRAHFRPSLEQT